MNQVSNPSKVSYIIDSPEISSFGCNFIYNFYEKSELTNDTGTFDGINLQEKFEKDSNLSRSKIFLSKVPRYVKISWTPVLSNVDIKTEKSLKNKLLIVKNYSKIVQEETLSYLNFVNANFQDGEIHEKVYDFLKRSFDLHSLGEKNISKEDLTNPDFIRNFADEKFSFETGDLIHLFLLKALNSGVSFEENKETLNSDQSGTNSSFSFVESLKNVSFNVTLNSRVSPRVFERTVYDPFSSLGNDLSELISEVNTVNSLTKEFSVSTTSPRDYFANIPFTNVVCNSSSVISTIPPEKRSGEVIGYVIEKTEHLKNGSSVICSPIIIGNPLISEFFDTKVKYGSTYSYKIKSINLFTLPVYDNTTGNVFHAEMLVSSKPSHKIYVETLEKIAPLPPFDFNFVWDYQKENLVLYWSFPPNPQNDIKKFQVFRRDNILHPFELIQEFDFSDIASGLIFQEKPDAKRVKKLKEPITFFRDLDFSKNSKHIYALSCVDAHGMSSNYSDQFEVSFDRFKNEISKNLISHSGAPKQYPNLYLENKLVEDVAKTKGKKSKSLTLFFTPAAYKIDDGSGNVFDFVLPESKNSLYRVQFINTDNQKMQTIKVKIKE